jgi:predicted polyphosphate/ATP-dependent NAD kinase
VMVADVGSYVRPRIPVVAIPSGVTGGSRAPGLLRSL